MSATFIQDGNFLDYLAPVDVPQGTIVVQGALIGIAHRAIPAGALGSLALTGVFDLPINPGIAAGAGQVVLYDPAINQLVVTAGAPPGLPRLGLLVRPLVVTDVIARVLLGW